MPSKGAAAQFDNRVLAELPEDVRLNLAHCMSGVTLNRGQTIVEAGESLRHAYFPTSALLAFELTTADGDSLELTSVGRGGAIARVLEAAESPWRVSVAVAGGALRMSTTDLELVANRHADLKGVLRDQAVRLVREVAEASLCYRAHDSLQRLSRWILCTASALETDTIPVTNERLMFALGACRSTITHAIAELQAAGAIWSRRGAIHVHHRGRLELTACRCYRR